MRRKTKTAMEKLTVVKVGGAVVEAPERLSALLEKFKQLRGNKILVHGGGRRATKVAAAMGIESHVVGGRRITDAAMLEVVTMVYGGLVNKNIVASLQALGIDAIGLTGADMDVIRAHRRPIAAGIDYGFVGDVEKVDAASLAKLLEAGAVPVVAPLTHDGHGTMLNTNADTIAAETAKAMSKIFDTTLVYCFEKPGVLADPDDDGSLIKAISPDTFPALKANGTISGGMVPKVENAIQAVVAGVRKVAITSADDVEGKHGTAVEKA